jgi:methylmalonyl-CoA mutase cobalamin-binding subunit
MTPRRLLCVPLDPVHDVGIKIIRDGLARRGHQTVLLSPDLPMEAIVARALEAPYEFILVSRTLGYGVAELLGRFVDMLDAAGVRTTARVVIGGKAVTPELAAELGFDRGFDEHATIEEIAAYIEDRPPAGNDDAARREKRDLTAGYTYAFAHSEAGGYLGAIVDSLLRWGKGRTTPGVERVRLREEMLRQGGTAAGGAGGYEALCDPVIRDAARNRTYPLGVREVTDEELRSLERMLSTRAPVHPVRIRHSGRKPAVFKFLGSGCPLMDIVHGRIGERWGIDGYLIINPSWEARFEGLLGGTLTHQNDGTITSLENIRLMRRHLDPATLLTVRAHRGLNTPETVLLAGEGGADMTKINLVYGSLGAGTDPERLAVDGIEAIRLAARYQMPFDIPGNDELSGVPAWKTLAGLLINVAIGARLGARPILKPLFCYGPHIVINGLMDQNFIDYNTAKIRALRAIVDAPIWPGEPIAFMTQSEDRVQSAGATSYHAALAKTLDVDAITIASTDEAYSRGPICVASRIDSIRAVAEGYRFVGDAGLAPTSRADRQTDEMVDGILSTLRAVSEAPSLPEAIHAGLLGNTEDGAYPGTFGRGTVH